MTGPFKTVVSSEYCGANRYTGYVPKSIRLTLQCGHYLFRKASQGIPLRARCRDCERNDAIVRDGSITCKRCSAEVADGRDETLAEARWGWTLAPDPGLGQDEHGDIPGFFYACPEHSDEDHQDAWSFIRKRNSPRGVRGGRA